MTPNTLFIKTFGHTLRNQQMTENFSCSMAGGKMEHMMTMQSTAGITQYKQC